MSIPILLGLIVSIVKYIILFKIGGALIESKKLLRYFGILPIEARPISEETPIDEENPSTVMHKFDSEKVIASIGKLIQITAVASIINDLVSTVIILEAM